MKELQIDYLDLLLIHWPIKFVHDMPKQPRLPSGLPVPGLQAQFEYIDTWKTFEALKEEGKVKNIGVSNFTISQLEDLISHCKIQPSVLQVEVHPYNTNVLIYNNLIFRVI